jgi:hypothetical protein
MSIESPISMFEIFALDFLSALNLDFAVLSLNFYLDFRWAPIGEFWV